MSTLGLSTTSANTAKGTDASPAEAYIVIALIAVSILLFGISVDYFAMLRGPSLPNLIGLIVLIAAGWSVSRRRLPLSFFAIACVINANSIIYLAGSWQTYSLSLENTLLDSVWLPVTVGLLAFHRPVLLAIPGLAMQWSKSAIASDAQLPFSGGADYVIIPDLGVLVSCLVATFAIYDAATRLRPVRLRLSTFDLHVSSYGFFTGCVIATAGIHLSNYFYSGWEKLFLPNSTPLTWVLKNPTYMLAVHTLDFKYFTIQTLLGGAEQFLYLIKFLNVPINVVVLVAQLSSVWVLLSVRTSALITLFFDAMHVAIFALSAILFWKWIVLNAGFVFAFGVIGRSGISVPRPIALLGCILVLLAPLLSFNIVRLAWFDTPGVNEVRFEARTVSGDSVRVPSNFFLHHSLVAARQRFADANPSYLPTNTWGTSGDGEVLQGMMANCVAMAEPWSLSERGRGEAERLVRHHHAMALRLSPDGSGRIAYDLYPHHIWSSPWAFADFAALDLRNIEAYVLVVEGRCVDVDDNGSISRVSVGSSRYEFPL